MKDYIRLIVSDTHLGSLHAKEQELYELLTTTEYDELILAGDIIDFIKVPRFTEYSALLFDYVTKLNKPVIYIIGNHDVGFSKFENKKINNVTFLKTYDFEYSGRKYRVQHGDQYESGLIHWRTTIALVSIFQDWFERVLKFNLAAWWVGLFEKKHQLKRIWNIIKKSNYDIDVFIMGHTHHPEALIWVDKDENIKTYINTGDWIENSTYVIIKNGHVRLKNYEKRKN